MEMQRHITVTIKKPKRRNAHGSSSSTGHYWYSWMIKPEVLKYRRSDRVTFVINKLKILDTTMEELIKNIGQPIPHLTISEGWSVCLPEDCEDHDAKVTKHHVYVNSFQIDFHQLV